MSKRTYFNGSFEQRTRQFFSITQGLPCAQVHSLAYDTKGILFAGTAKGLVTIDGKKVSAVSLPLPKDDCAVTMLFIDSRARVWAGSGNQVFCIDKKKITTITFETPVTAMDEGDDGALWLLTEDYLYKKENDTAEFIKIIDVPGIGNCLSVNGTKEVYAGTKKSGLLGLIGKRCHWAELFKEFTGLLSNTVNCISFDSTGTLWVGTDEGVCVYDGKSHWLCAAEVPSLPKGHINDMAFGADGSRWFATSTGLVLLKDGALRYYGFKRWVPSPCVAAVALTANGTVCAATDEGLSMLETQLMTLEQKAAYYQKTVEKYHVRKDGYVTVRFLNKPGEIEDGYVEVSDNDGTWTAMYMACQAYRFATTGEKDALTNARRTFRALQKLTTVTGIPGFTARAIRYPDETASFGDGDPEWHLDAKGECEWKGETSSDEMVGNFYGWSVYYDLAANEKEKAEITETVRNITDHILENNFKLVDFDGLPTTWANWAPEDLNYNDHWFAERGQNSLEILSFLKTTYYMTGDEKYNDVYHGLIADHHYLMNVMHYKFEDYHACHIDDELAMLVITPLLKYEKDPIIRSYIMSGFTHHWQYERIERTPLWSVIYGSLTGRHCDIEVAAESLEQLPLDLIHWPTYNSHRVDLEWVVASEEFWMPPQLKAPLPFDEKPMCKYDANPFHADSGIKIIETQAADGSGLVKQIEVVNRHCSGEKRVEDGTVFLHPYWMARYYGLLGD